MLAFLLILKLAMTNDPVLQKWNIPQSDFTHKAFNVFCSAFGAVKKRTTGLFVKMKCVIFFLRLKVQFVCDIRQIYHVFFCSSSR